ncbi:MAG: type II secretion system F family protein [Candidatus Wallbacteria bacterium]
MNYKVKVADRQGKTEQFTIEGETREAVCAALTNQGYFPLEIEKSQSGFSNVFTYENLQALKFKFKKNSYIIEFSRILAMLLNSGMSVTEAFKALSEKSPDSYSAELINDIKTSVAHGIPLSIALSRRGDIFDELFVKTIASAETTGNLSPALDNLRNYYQKKQALQKKLLSASLYPLIIMILSTIAVSYLFVSIVPTYTKLFSEMNANLPPVSEFVFFIADIIAKFYFQLLLMSGLLVYVIYRWQKTPEAARIIDEFTLKLPVINQFIYKKTLAIYYKTAGLLINSGINVISAIEVSQNVISNNIILERLKNAVISIKTGNSIYHSFEQSNFAAGFIPGLIKAGEDSNNLPEVFKHISETMESELDDIINTLESAFGPIILISVIGIFGVIIIAILLPMIGAATIVN